MKRKLLGLFAVLALAAPLSGCLTEGELGGGSFGYVCDSAGSDALCDGSYPGQELTIPAKIAVGGRFGVGFHPGTNSATASFLPDTASGEMILPVGSGFEFQKAGFGAILARDTAGRVGDFIHLHALDIDHLAVVRISTPVTDVKLNVGDTVTLRVRPADLAGETLGGGFTYTWAIKGDSSVLDLAPEQGGAAAGSNAADLTANAPGAVDISVQSQGKTAIVHVTVGGQP